MKSLLRDNGLAWPAAQHFLFWKVGGGWILGDLSSQVDRTEGKRERERQGKKRSINHISFLRPVFGFLDREKGETKESSERKDSKAKTKVDTAQEGRGLLPRKKNAKRKTIRHFFSQAIFLCGDSSISREGEGRLDSSESTFEFF